MLASSVAIRLGLAAISHMDAKLLKKFVKKEPQLCERSLYLARQFSRQHGSF